MSDLFSKEVELNEPKKINIVHSITEVPKYLNKVLKDLPSWNNKYCGYALGNIISRWYNVNFEPAIINKYLSIDPRFLHFGFNKFVFVENFLLSPIQKEIYLKLFGSTSYSFQKILNVLNNKNMGVVDLVEPIQEMINYKLLFKHSNGELSKI